MIKRIKKAFTLLELAAVIVILGVLAVVAGPSFDGLTGAAETNAAENSATSIANVARSLYESGVEASAGDAIAAAGTGVTGFDGTDTVVNGGASCEISTAFAVTCS